MQKNWVMQKKIVLGNLLRFLRRISGLHFDSVFYKQLIKIRKFTL